MFALVATVPEAAAQGPAVPTKAPDRARATGLPAAADPVALGFDPKRLARIDEWLSDEIDQGQLVGAVGAIVRRDRLAHLVLAGHLDRERGVAMRADTIFRIASMTKLLTSVAALSLYEEGAFLLDEPVSRFLPELGATQVGVFDGGGRLKTTRTSKHPITILDLMRHTSGLTYASPLGLRELYAAHRVRSGELTSAEVTAELAQLPLAEDPGTRWRYGLSTDVLGRMLEVIEGEPLDRVIARRILEPLGLQDTGFMVRAEDVGRLPPIYRATTEGLVVAEDPATSPLLSPPKAVSGGGGWGATGSLGGAVSSVADLLRLLGMLAGGGCLDGRRILAPSTVQMMTRDQLGGLDGPFEGCGYGLGVGVLRDPAPAHEPMGAGSWFWAGSENTWVWVDPQAELVGVFLTQLSPFGHARLMDRFQHLVYQALVGDVNLPSQGACNAQAQR